MENYSPLSKILMFVGFLVVASIVLSVVLSLTGTLIGFAFRWGIPILIAIVIVRWMTGTSRHHQRYRR